MDQRTLILAKTLSAFDTPTLANAIESFSVRDMTEGYASSLVRCLTPREKPMVGYAVTVTFDSTTPSRERSGPAGWFDLVDTIREAPKPVVVVSQYVGLERERGCWMGDVIATLMTRLGAVGTVTDTAVRDVPTILDRLPLFHVFAAGMVASHGNGRLVEIDVPVTVGGLAIRPGDLLHGDGNGLISIPLEITDGLAARARQGETDEAEFVRVLLSDPFEYNQIRDRFRH
jgi:4-hydroxy-4-methyl-2-oxoglutarate aldolase